MSVSKCVILVPYLQYIEPDCDSALRQLEAKGYRIERLHGCVGIDVARNGMASAALADGFDELMWIDADIAFNPKDVERLRSWQLPIVCGIYAKKRRREFACNFMAGTDVVLFGPMGSLIEVERAGFGFMLTRREVYEKMKTDLQLPECNQRSGKVIIPYFQPLIVPDRLGHRYLSEDYSFCHRAKQCGFEIRADTAIRLWHIGSYGFSWEDAGSEKERYETYTFRELDTTNSP